MSEKIRSTYNLSVETRQKMERLADLYGQNLTEIMETLVAQADENRQIKSLKVVNANPVVIAGDSWVGPYTGIVRVSFTTGSSILSMDLDVKHMTFSDFTSALGGAYDKLTRAINI